jgi:aminomethyltransferase
MRLIDRIITRDATKLAVDQVYYTSWCDEHGKVVDDGTITRLDETTYRWTAADPSLRWLRMNARGLDVEVEEISEAVGALALQGPLSRAVLEAATDQDFSDLKYFRRRAANLRGIPIDVTRTGYTGDLGYELWVEADRACDLWDAVAKVGAPYGIRPAGMLALDVVRVEAGLILLEADYTSSRHALIPEQAYSPFELGVLGLLTRFDKADYVGRRALEAELAAGGPARRLVGLEIDWTGIERLFASQDLPPMVDPVTSRVHVPVYSGRRQVGRATSTTWSPTLKRAIALASVGKEHADDGARLDVEWTVEARRSRAPAKVVPLPFFDPPRKRS